MPSEQSFLNPSDFGDFEPELKKAFKDAFHFAWDVGSEPPDEQERRQLFAPIVRAARSLPDLEPSPGAALMRESYALLSKLNAHLNPEDALHDQFAAISASISRIGKGLARLRGSGRKNSQRESPSVLDFRAAWTAIEEQLRAFRETFRASSSADELARLRDEASLTSARLADAREQLLVLSMPAANEVVASARAKDVAELAEAMLQISRRIEAFQDQCAPSLDDGFRPYLERLAQAIPAQSWYEGSAGNSRLCTEVPWNALAIHRDLTQRRGAILEALCTWDPEFFSLLPGSVRQDNSAPAATGGRGRQNWVLNGITAALILLGLVDTVALGAPISAKDLFKATVKRVERWIDNQTVSGNFFVKTTGEDTYGRRHARAQPLQLRYPIATKR